MIRCLYILACLALFAPCPASAAIKAVTEDGRSVVLREDGTWAFADQGKADPPRFARSALQNKQLPGLSAKYDFYYDPAQWSLMEQNLEPASEYEFEHSSGLVRALVMAHPGSTDINALEQRVLANIRKADDKAFVLYKEDRLVNGARVLCLQISAMIQESPVVFFTYLYQGKGYGVQAAVYAVESVFNSMYGDLEMFLNGLTAPPVAAEAPRPTPEPLLPEPTPEPEGSGTDPTPGPSPTPTLEPEYIPLPDDFPTDFYEPAPRP